MASSTLYKDELIRVALLVGLPDDTEPTTVADAVEAKLRAPVAIPPSRGADALERFARELEIRRERFGSAQAFADVTAVVQEMRDEALALRAS